MTAFVLLLVAYLVGSLPFGLWLARSHGVDLRASGSGNIGATNVLRTTGGLLAAVVLALDAAKGAVTVLLAQLALDRPWVTVGCAVAVVAGHVWPAWAAFRGGKGVATAAGAYGLLVPAATIWCVLVFVCVVATTRYVSMGSVAAVAALPVATVMFGADGATSIGAGLVAALVAWRHKSNIVRVINGDEPKVGRRFSRRSRRPPFVA